MESSFPNKSRTFRTHSYVFRTYQFPRHLPIIYEFDFKPLIDRGVVAVYMDDILVFTETNEQHTAVVREVLKILRDNNLFLKPEKCVYHQPEVEYLGLIIGNKQARMDPTKVSAIRDWPVPTKKQELQRFLGFCNFYCRFIKDYSKIAKPLTILTETFVTSGLHINNFPSQLLSMP